MFGSCHGNIDVSTHYKLITDQLHGHFDSGSEYRFTHRPTEHL